MPTLNLGNVVGYVKLDRSHWSSGIAATRRDMVNLREMALATSTGMLTLGVAGATALGVMTSLAGGVEEVTAAFASLLGGEDKATAMLGNLSVFAKEAKQDITQVRQSALMLLNSGTRPDNLIATMRAIAGAAAVSGRGAAGFEQISRALGQMQMKGRLGAEEMTQQLGEIVPAWQLLSTRLGMTVAEVMKAGEQGLLDAQTYLPILVDAMLEKYGGVLDQRRNQFRGKWTGLITDLKLTVEQHGEAILPLAKAGIDLLDRLGGALEHVNPQALLWGTGLLLGVGIVGKGTIALNAFLVSLRNLRSTAGESAGTVGLFAKSTDAQAAAAERAAAATRRQAEATTLLENARRREGQAAANVGSLVGMRGELQVLATEQAMLAQHTEAQLADARATRARAEAEYELVRARSAEIRHAGERGMPGMGPWMTAQLVAGANTEREAAAATLNATAARERDLQATLQGQRAKQDLTAATRTQIEAEIADEQATIRRSRAAVQHAEATLTEDAAIKKATFSLTGMTAKYGGMAASVGLLGMMFTEAESPANKFFTGLMSLGMAVPVITGVVEGIGALRGSLTALAVTAAATGNAGALMWLKLAGPVGWTIAAVAAIGVATYAWVQYNSEANKAAGRAKSAEVDLQMEKSRREVLANQLRSITADLNRLDAQPVTPSRDQLLAVKKNELADAIARISRELKLQQGLWDGTAAGVEKVIKAITDLSEKERNVQRLKKTAELEQSKREIQMHYLWTLNGWGEAGNVNDIDTLADQYQKNEPFYVRGKNGQNIYEEFNIKDSKEQVRLKELLVKYMEAKNSLEALDIADKQPQGQKNPGELEAAARLRAQATQEAAEAARAYQAELTRAGTMLPLLREKVALEARAVRELALATAYGGTRAAMVQIELERERALLASRERRAEIDLDYTEKITDAQAEGKSQQIIDTIRLQWGAALDRLQADDDLTTIRLTAELDKAKLDEFKAGMQEWAQLWIVKDTAWARGFTAAMQGSISRGIIPAGARNGTLNTPVIGDQGMLTPPIPLGQLGAGAHAPALETSTVAPRGTLAAVLSVSCDTPEWEVKVKKMAREVFVEGQRALVNRGGGVMTTLYPRVRALSLTGEVLWTAFPDVLGENAPSYSPQQWLAPSPTGWYYLQAGVQTAVAAVDHDGTARRLALDIPLPQSITTAAVDPATNDLVIGCRGGGDTLRTPTPTLFRYDAGGHQRSSAVFAYRTGPYSDLYPTYYLSPALITPVRSMPGAPAQLVSLTTRYGVPIFDGWDGAEARDTLVRIVTTQPSAGYGMSITFAGGYYGHWSAARNGSQQRTVWDLGTQTRGVALGEHAVAYQAAARAWFGVRTQVTPGGMPLPGFPLELARIDEPTYSPNFLLTTPAVWRRDDLFRETLTEPDAWGRLTYAPQLHVHPTTGQLVVLDTVRTRGGLPVGGERLSAPIDLVRGVQHLLWTALDGELWYAVSPLHVFTPSAPVRVASGAARPHLRICPDGRLRAGWETTDGLQRAGSDDGGRTWRAD